MAGGGNGASERERLRTMADAFQHIAGDALYTDTVGAIDRAESAGREALVRLARAHQQYAEGDASYEANRLKDAVPTLTAAASQLRAEGSPLAIRADLDLASVAYVSGQGDEAQRLLSATLATARASGYGYAVARTTRFLGMLAMGQGRLGEAQSFYEGMLSQAEGMGDAEQAAVAHSSSAVCTSIWEIPRHLAACARAPLCCRSPGRLQSDTSKPRRRQPFLGPTARRQPWPCRTR